MRKKILCLAIGFAGLFIISVAANAAAVDVNVTIQQANDDGSLVNGTAGTKDWDLSAADLWNSSTTNGNTINDLISTSLKWKNGGVFGSSAEFYINDLTFDKDPSLSFDFTLTNNTAFNQVYTVAYNTPLFPNLNGVIYSSANLTATLTDAGGVAGAKISPANGNGNIMRSWDITTNQNQISKNVDIGSALAIASGSTTSSWSANNSLFCPTGDSCETMSTILTLTLSKGDTVRLSGNLVQDAAVPLPAGIWFLGSALFGLAGLRRKSAKV